MGIAWTSQRLTWIGTFALGVGLSCITAGAMAAEPPAAKQGEATAKKPSGRLPAHYGEIVTPEQKLKIYALQTEYRPQLAAIREQLLKLQKELDAKTEAVLSPAQREKLAAVKAAASARRKAAKSAPAQVVEKSKTPPAGEAAKKQP